MIGTTITAGIAYPSEVYTGIHVWWS